MPAVLQVFAHQGGWDEMLFVAIPIGLFAGLLWLANKRASANLAAQDAEAAPEAAAQATDEPAVDDDDGPPHPGLS